MKTHIVPKASPDTLPELATYLKPFAPLFRRSPSRASVERYLTGLLTDLERKNCDTIAAAVAGTSTERLQHLLTDANLGAPGPRSATRDRLGGAESAARPPAAGRYRPAQTRAQFRRRRPPVFWDPRQGRQLPGRRQRALRGG